MLGQGEHRPAGVVRVCDAEHPGVKALVEHGLKEKEETNSGRIGSVSSHTVHVWISSNVKLQCMAHRYRFGFCTTVVHVGFSCIYFAVSAKLVYKQSEVIHETYSVELFKFIVFLVSTEQMV